MENEIKENLTVLSQNEYKDRVLKDFRIISLSRVCSVLGRREVLTGKGKFGIFGDGKEVAQIALNHFFNKGDFRSGYYRDQTFMIAQGFLSPQQLFAALYAHPDIDHEPMSAGRQMGAHFSTTLVNEKGEWLDQINLKNHISDISPTAGQIPRLVGLAQASKIYRSLKIDGSEKFSKNGNEIAWGTIGNASTSEGMFFEGINAAGVLQIPMVISVWDDGYGISVENKQHTVKESISAALEGFRASEESNGIEILTVNGWDYPALIKTYSYAAKIAREEHTPVLVHVLELTQPLGHSSSGSHERYKSKERLNWEKEYDCNVKMREWILSNGIATEKDLELIEKEVTEEVRSARLKAWSEYQRPIIKIKKEFNVFLDQFLSQSNNDVALKMIRKNLNEKTELFYHDIVSAARQSLPLLIRNKLNNTNDFKRWLKNLKANLQNKFSSHLYSEGINGTSHVVPSKPIYKEDAPLIDGRVILRDNFDKLLEKHDRLIIFGEDSGKIGGVNQGLEGLQEKYNEIRVADTGIREATIVGQGIGMALRGLRPIAEIQYLDYILYCIHTLSDDLASLSYRTKGRQLAPLIIRTRGHRLEGIWHSGSPMAAMIHLLRGIHIVVPRNMTQAAGFYNTLMRANQPAIVVESLNGYRLKEKMPSNLGDFCLAVGEVETLKTGKDITLVSYGSTLRMVHKVAQKLMGHDIDAEVIDIQTLIPFDLEGAIKESIAKTNKLLIIDEDMPGGGAAYILQQLLENQKIYPLLDSEPQLLSAKEHRTAYAEDGDYFSKPSEDDIFEKVYGLMHESNPNKYPAI
ncbi:thiamine pyrophosphate-dependent enzyme [Flavobacteriaceae bacterium]|nr:thiamine pyrophosphate-dependent enzyme [Flavobacteriaceae bacterium]